MADNIYATRVADIMTRDPVTLDTADTIHHALQLMAEHRVSTLPVVNRSDQCVGILSTSDLVDVTRDVEEELIDLETVQPRAQSAVLEKLASTLGSEPVKAYMSESMTTVGVESRIADAARKMLRNRVHHLPVVDHHERLIGIVSTMDILAEFVDSSPGQ